MGNPYDNALVESGWSKLKTDLAEPSCTCGSLHLLG